MSECRHYIRFGTISDGTVTGMHCKNCEVRLLLVLLAFPSSLAEICRIYIIPLCETADIHNIIDSNSEGGEGYVY